MWLDYRSVVFGASDAASTWKTRASNWACPECTASINVLVEASSSQLGSSMQARYSDSEAHCKYWTILPRSSLRCSAPPKNPGNLLNRSIPRRACAERADKSSGAASTVTMMVQMSRPSWILGICSGTFRIGLGRVCKRFRTVQPHNFQLYCESAGPSKADPLRGWQPRRDRQRSRCKPCPNSVKTSSE